MCSRALCVSKRGGAGERGGSENNYCDSVLHKGVWVVRTTKTGGHTNSAAPAPFFRGIIIPSPRRHVCVLRAAAGRSSSANVRARMVCPQVCVCVCVRVRAKETNSGQKPIKRRRRRLARRGPEQARAHTHSARAWQTIHINHQHHTLHARGGAGRASLSKHRK